MYRDGKNRASAYEHSRYQFACQSQRLTETLIQAAARVPSFKFCAERHQLLVICFHFLPCPSALRQIFGVAGNGGGLDDHLCFRNARPEKDGKGSLVVLLLAERAR